MSHATIDHFPYKPFAAAGTYSINSIYSFGGAGSDLTDGSLIQNVASDSFNKYTLGDRFDCSKGSYRLDGE